MLVIAGHLIVDAAQRDDYVADCKAVVEAAHAADGCLDYAITSDSVRPDHVRIYERWASEAQMLDFRGSGASPEQRTQIVDADVKRYVISAVEEA